MKSLRKNQEKKKKKNINIIFFLSLELRFRSIDQSDRSFSLFVGQIWCLVKKKYFFFFVSFFLFFNIYYFSQLLHIHRRFRVCVLIFASLTFVFFFDFFTLHFQLFFFVISLTCVVFFSLYFIYFRFVSCCWSRSTHFKRFRSVYRDNV